MHLWHNVFTTLVSCFLAGKLKHWLAVFYETWQVAGVWEEDDELDLWSDPDYRSRNYLKDSSTLREGKNQRQSVSVSVIVMKEKSSFGV